MGRSRSPGSTAGPATKREPRPVARDAIVTVVLGDSRIARQGEGCHTGLEPCLCNPPARAFEEALVLLVRRGADLGRRVLVHASASHGESHASWPPRL